MTEFQPTTTTYRQGARTLPGELYTSAAIMAEERERIFARSWNCVGRASRIAQPGDYFVCEVAGESILVVRDSRGAAHAFFNVCRHRGNRICREPSGRFVSSSPDTASMASRIASASSRRFEARHSRRLSGSRAKRLASKADAWR